ncbi:peptide chain release factor N(5)-glutamine methyltransferase [Melioribacter sp. OK-6-Me]|uniref:peptide chain release factor N(5)-glutamine methyltransferase n=1 Tax=unclassified Melioribacter TaxID=2627329 RepID=UPI003EDAD2B5
MLNILKAITLSAEYLEKKGVESPRLNAELLLADVLKCKRMDLYLQFDQPLKEVEIERYRELIRRRGAREPLQYILGYTEFYGLKFDINQYVLIPRPETELLVEKIIDLYKDSKSLKILDVGTGSGNIAVTLGLNLNDVRIVAIDKSNEALQLARHNAEMHGIIGSIEFIRKDIFDEYLFHELQFDIIVSNPPYVSYNEYNKLQEEVARYEPDMAVTDFKDGLSFYRRITEMATQYLSTGGRLFFELGQGHAAEVASIMKNYDFINIEIIQDYQKIDRIIFGQKS